MTDHSHPGAVIHTLSSIDADLGERMNDYEAAAGDRARLTRDWEKRLAVHGRRAAGSSQDIRKATALVAAIEQDDLYERLTDAEARYEALRVVVRVLETRASLGQSVLRVQGRA